MADFEVEALSKLHVAELKEKLATRNLPTSGLKEDLVNRLQEALEGERKKEAEEGKQLIEQEMKTVEERKRMEQERKNEFDDKFMQMLSFMREMRIEMKTGQEEMNNRIEEMKTGQEEMNNRIEEMKTGQDVMSKRQEEGQEEMKNRIEEMKTGQEEMKNKIEEMKTGQEEIKIEMKNKIEEMKAGQEEMKNKIEEMKAEQEEMKIEMKAEQEEMKIEMKNRIDEKIKTMEEKLEERFGKLQQEDEKIKTIEEKLEEKIGKLQQQIKKQFVEELRKNHEYPPEFEVAAENSSQATLHLPAIAKPSIKLPLYEGKTSWKVYKTQFDIVAEANGWDPITKARQLAASLRAEAADILRTVPETDKLHFDYLSNALELRFGDKCSQDYSRLQLKTRSQRTNETLQELATDIERLSHLAFADCPSEVRETLAVQYFVDGINDSEIQKALRMAEIKDLKSALIYAIKFEVAQQASRKDRHSIRGAELKKDEDPALGTMTKLLEEIRDMKKCMTSNRFSQQKNTRCWKCGSENHLQRNCQAYKDQRNMNTSPKSVQEN